MAKKVENTTKTKKTNTKVNKETFGDYVIEGEVLTATIAPNKTKSKLETINLEELVALEKACASVCGRYEIKARLSGEDNAKFIEFSNYHKNILTEMEKRVLKICKTN